MTNDEFQKIVLSALKAIRNEMATKQELADGISCLKSKLDALALTTQEDVKGMLNHIKDKTELLPQIDERLENIEDDLNYLARKSAKFGTEIVKLKKTYKKTL